MNISDIRGIIPPLITPLLDEGTLDVEGVEKLVEHLVQGGVHGLFILGTTGEGPSLGYDLRIELIENVCEQVDDRVPVLVGITDSSFSQAVQVAEAASDIGAQATVLAPPFYYKIEPTELHDFIDRIISKINLPVFLYDNPGLTGVKLDIDTVQKLIRHPEVIGFKDSSGDSQYFHQVKTILDEADIPLLVGPEELLTQSLIMGADGGVPGGANMFPNLYVSLYDSVESGNVEAALDLHNRILQISSIVYQGNEYGSSCVINGIKSALSLMDICNATLAPPLKSASPKKTKDIKEFVLSQ